MQLEPKKSNTEDHDHLTHGFMRINVSSHRKVSGRHKHSRPNTANHLFLQCKMKQF